jgi:hypothetical protein
MSKKSSTRKVNRSSITGKFVKDSYAKTHPKTTETEKVRTNTKKK